MTRGALILDAMGYWLMLFAATVVLTSFFDNKMSTGEVLAIVVPAMLVGAGLLLRRYFFSWRTYDLRFLDSSIDYPPIRSQSQPYRKSCTVNGTHATIHMPVKVRGHPSISDMQVRFVQRYWSVSGWPWHWKWRDLWRIWRWDAPDTSGTFVSNVTDEYAHQHGRPVGPVDVSADGPAGVIVYWSPPREIGTHSILWFAADIQATKTWSGHLSVRGTTSYGRLGTNRRRVTIRVDESADD